MKHRVSADSEKNYWPHCCLMAVWLLVGAGALAGAQPLAEDEALARVGLPGLSPRTTRRLAAADKLAAEQKWTEAVDEYIRILNEAGDDLVALDAQNSLSARRLCHLRLAASPAAALRLYRARTDGQAKKWLEQGTVARDPRLLRRVADDAFCSRFTDQALDLLGDLAFERGDFEEAERCWRMLALPASQSDKTRRAKDELVFPDPQIDVARVRAKQILARLFRRDRDKSLSEERKAFQDQHGQAAGQLGGRKGKYADFLQNLFDHPEQLASPSIPEFWATFGGNFSRNGILPRAEGRFARLPHLEGPQWTVRLDSGDAVELPKEDAAEAKQALPSTTAARLLPFYPLLVDDRVLVADAHSVSAYDLLTGERTLHYDLSTQVKDALPQKVPTEPDGSYTLTATEDKLYARMGTQDVGPQKGELRDSFLVCLNLPPKKGTAPLHLGGLSPFSERWRIKAQTTDAGRAVFEGAPIVYHGLVLIAMTRSTGLQTQTALACYDSNTGASRWQRDLCAAPEVQDAEHRFGHHLLTLAGTTAVYCSHSGVIAAVDAATGRRLWALRYPSRGPKTAFGETPLRSLNPCVSAGRRLFVAPADLDRILCLETETGHKVWESTPIEVVHLLGVANGRLIFTFGVAGLNTPARGIRAIEAASGDPIRTWFQPADGGDLPPLGRGLLAGEYVFWPTRDGLHVLYQEDGEPVFFDKSIRGNLAAANGCLIVAGTEYLSAYVPAGRLLKQRQEDADQNDHSALAHYRLSVALADVGRSKDSLEHLQRAQELAGPVERWHGELLVDLAQRGRYDVLLQAAQGAQDTQQWSDAASYLDCAAAVEFAPGVRLRALSLEAALWNRAGQPTRALAIWQRTLEDPSLSRGQIMTPAGLPQPANWYASEQIARLIDAHGRSVYDRVEKRARTLFEQSRGTERQEVLGRLGRDFPNAEVTGTALLELAQLGEKSNRPGAAADAYRQYLRGGKQCALRPAALAALARAYERESCWSAARSTWQQLAREAGDRIIPALDPVHPLREKVARELGKPEYHGAGRSLRPDPCLPLKRAWESNRTALESQSGSRYLLPGDTSWQTEGDECLFSLRGNSVLCVGACDGKTRWRKTLLLSPSWLERLADRIILAGSQGIQSLRCEDGEFVWSFLPERGSESAQEGPGNAKREGTRLSAFRLVDSRLFFLQNERRLFALDAEDGRVLWSAWAPAARLQLPFPRGRFYPDYYSGPATVIAPTAGGKLFVLDSQTGRQLREVKAKEERWPRPPLALDEGRVCLMPDREHVMFLDRTDGKAIWDHAIEFPGGLSGEPPQLLGNGERLLVLICRNYGYFLECLDLVTGKPRWPEARFLGTKPVDLETGTLDQSAAYFVTDNTLQAVALDTGRTLWQRPLPEAARRWRTLRTRSCLIVFPAEAARSALAGAGLVPRTASSSDGGFAVCLCDLQNGQLLQRLNFQWKEAAAISETKIVQNQQFVLPEASPSVQISQAGMSVVQGGRAWRFHTSKKSAE